MPRPKKEQAPAENIQAQPDAVQPTEQFVKPVSLSVAFTGDPRGGKDPEIAEYGGKLFPKGKVVTIDDPNWIAINAKIRKNNHFTVK